MKKVIAVTLSAAMLVSAPAVGLAHWSDSYSGSLIQQQVITAEDTIVKNPDVPANRGDLARMVSLLKGLTYSGTEQSFSDVDTSHPYYTYCEAASKAGFIAGYGDGTFRPENSITRQDAFAIFGRAYQITGDDSQTFTDSSEIDAYAKDYITGMKKLGIISGYPDGSVQPKAEITNAEVVTIAYFLDQKFGQSESSPTPAASPTSKPKSSPTPAASPTSKPIGSGTIGGSMGGGSRPSIVTTPTPTPTVTPSPTPGINTGSAKLSQKELTQTVVIEGGYEVTMPYVEISVASAVPVKQAEWVMMTEENENLIQAFSKLKDQAQTLEGDTLIAKKNGRYLFKIKDTEGALTFAAIDVTGIPSVMEKYIAYGEDNSVEEMTEFILRFEPNLQEKNTELTRYPSYAAEKCWIVKKTDLEKSNSVWYNTVLEKLVENEEECKAPVTLTENGEYMVVYQDQNGNFFVKDFALHMAYDMNLKAEAAPREDENYPAVITVSYDQKPAEIRVLYSGELLEAPNDTTPWYFYQNEWEYFQKHREEAVLLEGDTFEAKTAGDYCIYAKAEDGTEMMTKVTNVSVTGPKITVDSMTWLSEDTVKVKFSLEPNPNAQIVQVGRKSNYSLPVGNYADNKYLSDLLDSPNMETIELQQNSFLLTGEETVMPPTNKIIIAAKDEWGNCGSALSSCLKPQVFLSVVQQEQEDGILLTAENKEAFAEIKWIRVDEAVEEADAPDVFEKLLDSAQLLSENTMSITQNGTYLFWAKDAEEVEQIKVIRVESVPGA